MDRRSPLVGSLIVLTAGCLFAMLGVLSRTAFDAGMTPFTFVGAARFRLDRSRSTGPDFDVRGIGSTRD